MKVYWGSGGIFPLILDLGNRWRWVVIFTPRPLYPQGNNPQYPLDRRMVGPQSRSGRGGEEKNKMISTVLLQWNIKRIIHFIAYWTTPKSRGSSITVVTRLWAGRPGFIFRHEQLRNYFCSPPLCPDQLWGPLSYLFNGQWVSFPGGKAAWAWSWTLTSSQCRGKRMGWSYTSTPPVSLHGVVLSKSIGTTLHLPFHRIQ